MHKNYSFLHRSIFFILVLLFLLGFIYFFKGPITGYQIFEGNSPVTPSNLVPIFVEDTIGASGSRWVRSGFNLPVNANVYSPDNIRLLKYDSSAQEYYEVDSDIHVLNRRGGVFSELSKEIWWFVVVFKTDDLIPNEQDSYYIDYGPSVQRSTLGGLSVTSGPSGYTINSNSHVFEINSQAYSIFDKVSVNGLELISPGSQSGIWAEGSDGTMYSSKYDSPSISLVEQGNVHATFRVQGHLRSSGGISLVQYDAFVHVYSDGYVDFSFVTEKPGDITDNVLGDHARFNWLEAVLDLNQLSQTSDYFLTEFNSGVSSSGSHITAYQDFKPINRDFDLRLYNTDPTDTNLMDNFYLRIVDQNSLSTLYYDENNLESQSGSRSDGVVGVSYTNGAVVAVVEDFWQNSPRTLTIENSDIRVGFWGREHSSQSYLTHNFGPVLRTDPTNVNNYYYFAYTPSSGATELSQFSPLDVQSYIVHKSTGEYNRMSLFFLPSSLSQPDVLNLAKKGQESLIVFPSESSYYRTSLSMPDRFSFVEERDWTQDLSDPILRDAANILDSWGRSLWDENSVTQNVPSFTYPKSTLLNRQKMGTCFSGCYGMPYFGLPYYGTIYWQAEGWLHNAFGIENSIMTHVMRVRDQEAFRLLRGFLLSNSIETPYRWVNFNDAIAGSRFHEKGNKRLGYFQNLPPSTYNSPRHQWEEGIALFALMTGNLHSWKGMLLSSVDYASGYYPIEYTSSFAPRNYGQTGNQLGRISVQPYGDLLSGPLGPQLRNLIGNYHLTGDPQYVYLAKQYLTSVKNYIEACEAIYGVKIYSVPSQGQQLTPTNTGSNCNPSGSDVTQSFLMFYLMSASIRVLEADLQVNGQYDPNLYPFFLDMINDYFTYVVSPAVSSTEPVVGQPYTPIRIPNDIAVHLTGTNPQSLTTYCSNPSSKVTTPLQNGYSLTVCDPGTADMEDVGSVLLWSSYQTGNSLQASVGRHIIRDSLLYRSPNLQSGQTLLFGDPSQYMRVAWRHLGLGLADVKVASPFVYKPLPAFSILAGLVPPAPITAQTCNQSGSTQGCYISGLLGACAYGQSTCSNSVWSSCTQTVFPNTEICGNLIDENCDGVVEACLVPSSPTGLTASYF